MRKTVFTVLAVLVCMTGMILSVNSFAGDDSLLSGRTYPPPDCRSPLRPLPGDGPRDWRMYRSEMERYRLCVERYLSTARQDMERIRKQMDKAVREYNQESGNSL